MAHLEQEQVLADFLSEERLAVTEAHTLSERRVVLAREVMRLDAQLTDVAAAGDAALLDALRPVWDLATQHHAKGPGALVAWGEVEPVVIAAIEAVGAFRQQVRPVVEAMAENVRAMATLLAVVDAEIDARAVALLATKNVELATEAIRLPLQ